MKSHKIAELIYAQSSELQLIGLQIQLLDLKRQHLRDQADHVRKAMEGFERIQAENGSENE